MYHSNQTEKIRVEVCFYSAKNHLVLMHLWRQRAVQNGAMMDVQDRENPALDTLLQPRADEMSPIGMHVIPHQRGVLESGGNYIGTAIGIQRMAMEPSTFFYQRIANRPLPRENDEELISKKNHLVLMQLGQQRAEQDGAMHVIPHQRRVLETEGNYIGTAIGIQRMAVQPSTIFHQRIGNRPLPRENDE